MKLFRSFISNTVFALNVLLLFLVLFQDYIVVPVWLQPVGRMHPLLLHLPIGFLLLSTLLVIFRNGFKKKAFHNFLNFVLYFAALTAVITAIMGLLLSQEGGYDETQLRLHLIGGVTVSFLSAVLLWISLYELKRKKLFNISLAVNTLALLIAGHLGSVLTHGDNFILQPLTQDTEEIITDSSSFYAAAIHPILKAKCMGCHNARKLKGDLNMSTLQKIAKGGKNGPIWIAGNPDNSEIIRRIHLPEENDDHMPPAGKTQLSDSESKLLYQWIKTGADVTTPWTKFNPTDSLRFMAEGFIHTKSSQMATHYTFAYATKETVQSLNSPFCSVTQVSSDEPGLKADFFLSQAFASKNLEGLLAVKDQLVILNLSKMPVNDDVGTTLSQFKNLERLNLNQTNITGKILASLKELTHLQSLSVAGTAVDFNSVDQFASLASLHEIFLWNSKVTRDEKQSLQKKFPEIAWDGGYESKETLRLTPPLLVNENFMLGKNEPVILKHNLPGTQMRYTLNGIEPDSVSGTVYQQPISISSYSVLEARAFKGGWYSSPVAQFYFFKQGIKPTEAELVNPPNKDYQGEGSVTLTDNKKGSADNFRDIAWLGYREKPFVAIFTMASPHEISNVTVSYCENAPSYLLPPAWTELWAGNDRGRLKLIQKLVPQQPEENGPRTVKGIVFHIPPSNYKYFKVIAQPVAKVPVWVSKKPEKGWVFVDEVIFN